MSLRARVTLALLSVVIAGLLVSDLATYQALRTFLLQRVDAQVDALRGPTIGQLFREGRPPAPPTPPGAAPDYVEVRDSSDQVVLRTNGAPFGQTARWSPLLPARIPVAPVCAPNSCDTSATLEVPSRDAGGPRFRVHVWSLPTPSGTYQMIIAVPLSDVAETLARLLVIDLMVTLGVAIGAAVGGFYLVQLGLRPLREIEVTASAIAAGDLARRVPRAGSRTEIGRLGTALNAMLGQIEAAFQQKDASERRLRRFLADASHALRTPLTSIRGYSELFRMPGGGAALDLQLVMGRIEEESRRMGELVDDLLLLARLDQGRPLEQAAVDLGGVATEAVEAARRFEPDRPILLELGAPAVVVGDVARLRQVLDKLLDNVRAHTPPGTPAMVCVYGDLDGVVIEVLDRGPGMTEEARAAAFEGFFAGDRAGRRDRGAAGLGLTVVEAIVSAHSGTVAMFATVPTGITVRIALPVRVPSQIGEAITPIDPGS
ncbi:MAG: HAMP domain-containing sensor histidine kinase [Candidatus Dormibacteria bacterium]